MFTIREEIAADLDAIRAGGLYKAERPITTAQSAHIATDLGDCLNFCANNYLGLADNPEVIAAAKHGLDDFGYGTASVRFICGTQTIHRELEQRIATYVGMEDSILFASCFDANGGIFEVLLGPEDAVVSDELNHASIIDGIRLCKAERLRYRNSDIVAQAFRGRISGTRRSLLVNSSEVAAPILHRR